MTATQIMLIIGPPAIIGYALGVYTGFKLWREQYVSLRRGRIWPSR